MSTTTHPLQETFAAVARGVFAVGMWVVGFVLTAWLASVWLPPRELPSSIREKLAHLTEHGDDYGALFVGSSRIQSHVIPHLFDQLAAQGGTPLKSFNAGVASMRTPEDAWMLDQILARKPQHLHWVFLEIDFFQTVMQEDQKGTLRGVNWHDWPRFRQLCRRLLIMKNGLGWREKVADTLERLGDFSDHLAAFGQRSTQFGRGRQLFDRWRTDAKPEALYRPNLGPDGDGWIPMNRAESADERGRQRLEDLASGAESKAPRPQKTDRVSQAVLGEAIDKIIRAGALPILVIPPRTRVSYFVPSPENARRAAVINLCDPVKYPELYEARYRIDTSHLNPAGAEVFTRIVAARFLEITHPASPPAP